MELEAGKPVQLDYDPGLNGILRVELVPEGGAAKSHFLLSDYYRVPEHRQSRVVFKAPPGALDPGVSYLCRIYPVGFFGAEGRPVQWRFTTKPGYRCRSEGLVCVQE